MATIGDLFTPEEIARARALHAEASPGTFARRCAEEVVGPALPRIDRLTGQGNDALYLAYALEFALGEVPAPRR